MLGFAPVGARILWKTSFALAADTRGKAEEQESMCGHVAVDTKTKKRIIFAASVGESGTAKRLKNHQDSRSKCAIQQRVIQTLRDFKSRTILAERLDMEGRYNR